MGTPIRRGTMSNGWQLRRTNETMRLIITTFVGIIFGFFLGVSFPSLSLTKVNLSSNIFPSVDLTYIDDKYSGLSTQALLNVWSALKGRRGIPRKFNNTKIWVPTNPRGAERLPPGILVPESDFHARRLWGLPAEDLIVKPRYLMTFTVGYDQKNNIDAAVKKLTENFQVLLFHYDGRTSEWDEFEWSKRAIHVSVRKQTKWWYAKRFLHPDIVATTRQLKFSSRYVDFTSPFLLKLSFVNSPISSGSDLPMEDDDKAALSRKLIDVVGEIAAFSDYRITVKRQYTNLARRLKLLTPMFEEIRDSKEPLPEDSVRALAALQTALESAKDLLRFGSEGSKIYLVLERDQIMNRFQEVTAELEQALSGISFEKLDISDEVKEQVELVLAQFRRAKGRVDAADVELYEDLLCLYNKNTDAEEDIDALKRLVDKLQLGGIADLTQESLALHEMVGATGGDPEESIEKMSMLLKKVKEFVQTVNPNIDSTSAENSTPTSSGGKALTEANQKNLVIPDDFRCPISLELMKDPVIVSTGQTYERLCIEKWLEAGHSTCPKTQQALTSTALTPNYVLRSLIAQWCEANGIEPPKRPGSSRPSKPSSACSPAERSKIGALLCKLTSGNPEDQRSAAGEIRLLAKRNADNRVAIAEAGAIPLLVQLLSTPDSRTQEHAVTALLNLSICEDNKGSIISSGAVPGIVHVLKKGSMEARENAAATLFSLSVIDENKVTIGASGAIPPLVTLLSEGTQRGKKDAATALFNLCIYQGNKGKAVRARVIPTLMRLLTEPQGSMVDEALAILAILSSHPEGKVAIGAAEAVPVLVDVIGNGSPRNKENAAAVMVHLCSGDQQHIADAQELGVMGPLLDLAQHGTERGKRKAAQLLERMNRFEETQKAARAAQAENQTQNQAAQPPPSGNAENS